MRIRIKGVTTAVTVVASLAALAAATSADAATYYACVKKRGGAVRLVSKTAKCRRSERRISFNGEGIPGRNGANGANGINGTNGANGSNGENGITGFTSTLPKGQTESGTWGANGSGGAELFSPISFNIPLASAPAVTVTELGPEGPKHPCPGTVAKPSADPGHLCIYINTGDITASVGVFDPATGTSGAEVFGTLVRITNAGKADGTWAVTG